MLVAPPPDGSGVALEKGPNIVSLPTFEPLPDDLSGPVLLKLGDDVSTDEIMPAGARVLPYRSNIPAMADYAFDAVDDTYAERARRAGDHFIVAGSNYGQGSSREHAAIVPRYLGLRVVLAKSFARIHRQNLLNFAVLTLSFERPDDYDRVEPGDILAVPGGAATLRQGPTIDVVNENRDERYQARHGLSPRAIEIMVRGSLLDTVRGER
jgi:aconitate hydratase